MESLDSSAGLSEAITWKPLDKISVYICEVMIGETTGIIITAVFDGVEPKMDFQKFHGDFDLRNYSRNDWSFFFYYRHFLHQSGAFVSESSVWSFVLDTSSCGGGRRAVV